MIKNIIFDFGGVIHDIRYENVGEAFVRHGVTHLGTFYTKDFQTSEMDLFEKEFTRLKEAIAADDTETVKQMMITSTERRKLFNK